MKPRTIDSEVREHASVMRSNKKVALQSLLATVLLKKTFQGERLGGHSDHFLRCIERMIREKKASCYPYLRFRTHLTPRSPIEDSFRAGHPAEISASSQAVEEVS